jgi:hypothetical protein
MKAIDIILNEAESSALGDNNQEVLNAIKSFRDGEENLDVLDITWTSEDVIEHAKCAYEIDVTIDQARDALRLMEHSHDANFGISWDTIGYAIEDIAGIQWNPKTKTYEQK